MLGFYILLALISLAMLYFSGGWIIDGLLKVARFLKWREFVLAFIIVALAATLPNLFVGIASALHKVPQLSFGDIVGGNVIDLTLIVAIAALIAGGLPAQSRTVQTTSLFTIIFACLPIFLILDGILGRGDGLILIFAYFFYLLWLFSKKERFTLVYNDEGHSVLKQFKLFLQSLGKIIVGVLFLVLASEGIVRSSLYFVKVLNVPISLIGILVVSLGNSIPEGYFAIVSAKRGYTWMILGDLMGSIIAPSTLVLGIVSLICPIQIFDLPHFAIARVFLILAAIFFFFFVRTGRKVSTKEAIFLLIFYVLFLLSELFI